ncbi:MAG TPA: hypothetical protein VK638_42640 [Edaphobacter sp.]|nr:hypothetical protein [Edaphobacter sp.]
MQIVVRQDCFRQVPLEVADNPFRGKFGDTHRYWAKDFRIADNSPITGAVGVAMISTLR